MFVCVLIMFFGEVGNMGVIMLGGMNEGVFGECIGVLLGDLGDFGVWVWGGDLGDLGDLVGFLFLCSWLGGFGEWVVLVVGDGCFLLEYFFFGDGKRGGEDLGVGFFEIGFCDFIWIFGRGFWVGELFWEESLFLVFVSFFII